MKTWDVPGLDVEAHKPEVLSSGDAARVIVLHLPEGEQLQEHEVHERAWILVLAGEIELTPHEGEPASGGAGLLAEFDPGEPHQVSARADSRLVLFLAPWPGEGHPGTMPLEQKASVRERAHERGQG